MFVDHDAAAMLPLKLLLSPALIGLASWIADRRGPSVAGWLTSFPLTSGPVLLGLAHERGPLFAAETCVGITLAVLSVAAFANIYARCASTFGWQVSSVLALAAFLTITWLLQYVAISLVASFVIACLGLGMAIRVMPHHDQSTLVIPTIWWDIPLRMVLAATLVCGVTAAASVVGARVSGLLTPFPSTALILAAFTHRANGGAAAGQLLRGLLAGLFSFATFFLVAGQLLTRTSIVLAFSVATVCALATHAVVGFELRRRASVR